MRLRDMEYIGFKHRRENKQNSDKGYISVLNIEGKINKIVIRDYRYFVYFPFDV